VALRHLQTADGQETTEAAVTDPAQWAVLLVEDTVLVDAVTGEPVDEADIDWSTEHHADRQPVDAARHANTVVEKTAWVPEYFAATHKRPAFTWRSSSPAPSPSCADKENATTPKRPTPAPKRSAPSGERCWR